MPVYTNPTIDQEISPKAIFYVDNKCAIFTCNGSPEGVILANTGSIAISDNGSIYKKTTDDLTTGWIELTGGTVSSPLVISGTNPTLSFVDTDVGDDDGTISMQSDVMSIGVAGGTLLQIRSNGQILNVPRNLTVDISVVGNVGAGLDALHTFSLPANSLAANGDFVKAIYSGTFATNDNDKLILITFAGQTVATIGSTPFDQDSGQWKYEITFVRLTATSVLCSTMFTWNFVSHDGAGTNGGNGIAAANNITIAVPDLSANASTMLVSATGVANNDIVQNLSIIDLVQR
jgi:hypothetical protein